MPDADEHKALAWLLAALLAASGFVLWPFVTWILLAIWAAALLRPIQTWLAVRLRGRPRLAATLATLLLVLLAVPAVVVVATLGGEAIDLVRRVLASDQVQTLLSTRPAAGAASGRAGGSGLFGLLVSQGERAWGILQQVAGTAAYIAIGLVILIGGTYGVLVDGPRWSAWLEAHAPIAPEAYRRLHDAVIETGRGLVFGILGAGLAQAAVATVLYVALDVPEPFALGLLTLAGSIVPAIGTAIVWVPITIALAATGRTTAAIILGVCGVVVIGSIDNLVRPYLARRGRLQMPTFIVALAMFGGVMAFGADGIALGPLALRLGKEILAIWRERRAAAAVAA